MENKLLDQTIQLNAMSRELSYIYKRVNDLLTEMQQEKGLTQEEMSLYYKVIDIMRDASMERQFYEVALRERYKDVLENVNNIE